MHPNAIYHNVMWLIHYNVIQFIKNTYLVLGYYNTIFGKYNIKDGSGHCSQWICHYQAHFHKKKLNDQTHPQPYQNFISPAYISQSTPSKVFKIIILLVYPIYFLIYGQCQNYSSAIVVAALGEGAGQLQPLQF